ncbi:hypothetical protein [Pedococcus bigeumensis]|uniref:hypothetical protein n=1 Tax=Pedococcus bigeumensis TaxID=433644 RepID=UPI002FE7B2ED
MTTFLTGDPGSSDEYELSDTEVDAMLKGHRPLGGPPEVQRVADAMNALTSPPERAELGGYSGAMATYGSAFTRRRSRRVAMISAVGGLRALASAAGAAVALGGVATIVLASGAMGPAHQSVAPPVAATSSTQTTPPQADATGTPVGPDASGPAAFGLCNAWTNHQAKDDDKPGTSVAFRNLAEAAGGEAKIAAYCAKVPHPGSSSTTRTPKGTAKPKGKATSTAPKPGKAPATPPGKARKGSGGNPRTPGAGPTTTTPPTATLTPPGPPATLPTRAS